MTLYIATLLFGITGILGIYLSSLVPRGKSSSKPVILLHGLISITGFVLLVKSLPESLTVLILLSVATCCGLVLLWQDITDKHHTQWLCYAHGVITILRFIFLVVMC
jgi:ACR3 family arsenite efflux pump ArsB